MKMFSLRSHPKQIHENTVSTFQPKVKSLGTVIDRIFSKDRSKVKLPSEIKSPLRCQVARLPFQCLRCFFTCPEVGTDV